LTANERYVDNMFDYNRCLLVLVADGEVLLSQEFSRQEGRAFHFPFDLEWSSGKHDLSLELKPLTPDEKQIRPLSLRIGSVTVRGPLEKQFWTKPPNYERFFPREVPEGAKDRLQYAREILGQFAKRAFRRPVDIETVERLAKLAESESSRVGESFESGVG